jgi:hypothetical protein
MDIVEGGCLCAAVRYRASGAALATSNCHCRTCRRASGAPSVAWVVLRADDFAFVSGKPITFRSSPPVIRTFCGECGTPLTYKHDDSPGTIDVTTATLDRPELFPPTREIWLDHKISWAPVNATLRQFAGSSLQKPRPTA